MADNLSTKCKQCHTAISNKDLAENLNVCPHCEHHFPAKGRDRIAWLAEASTFAELDAGMTGLDMLNLTAPETYGSKLADCQKTTGQSDAVVTGIGKVGEHRVGLGVMDFDFLGGSMGSVVGEKLTRLIEKCTQERMPVIVISSSGGARIYEGMFSLMQMPKTCAALARHEEANLPCISVLTNPTMAGVLASYASLGSLIIAEPGAMIGFAGPRVIERTTRAQLPSGFQTAEFLLDHGFIDAIIPRKEMRKRIGEYLNFMTIGNEKSAATG